MTSFTNCYDINHKYCFHNEARNISLLILSSEKKYLLSDGIAVTTSSPCFEQIDSKVGNISSNKALRKQ
jgi:hypothetical protein